MLSFFKSLDPIAVSGCTKKKNECNDTPLENYNIITSCWTNISPFMQDNVYEEKIILGTDV